MNPITLGAIALGGVGVAHWLSMRGAGGLQAVSDVGDDEITVELFAGRQVRPVPGAGVSLKMLSGRDLQEILVDDGISTRIPEGGGEVGLVTAIEAPASHVKQGAVRLMLATAMRTATHMGLRQFYLLSDRSSEKVYRALGFEPVTRSGSMVLMKLDVR
jgi:hypothetical protein